MGLEGLNSSVNKLLESSGPTADTGKLLYRTSVELWMSRVRAFAMDSNTGPKGVANGFCQALLATMKESFRKVMEAEIKDGTDRKVVAKLASKYSMNRESLLVK